MRFQLPVGALALAFLAGLWAPATCNAQSNPAEQANPAAQGPEKPGSVKGDTQPAGSEPPVANTQNTEQSAPSGPIGAGPETMPAKFNEDVAARDRIPIMARPLPLTDDQKRQIYDSVMNDTQVPVTRTQAEPAAILPGSVELSELPRGLEDQIAAVRGYKYVKLQDKVLLVAPANRVVVGEIAR